MGFSIGKKEAKEKKAKTRPQVDSNPCSTGPEASIVVSVSPSWFFLPSVADFSSMHCKLAENPPGYLWQLYKCGVLLNRHPR